MTSTGSAPTYQSASRRPGVSLGHDAHAGHPPVPAWDRLHLMAQPELDAAVAQQREPRVDPHVAGRAVEDAVRLSRRARHVEEQLQQDVAAGARAHLSRPRGHERAREAVRQVLRVVLRPARVRAGELPPALALVLREAALLAARQEQQQPVDEVGRVLRGDPDAVGVLEEEAEALVQVPEVARKVHRREQLLAGLGRHLHLAGCDEVVRHRTAAVGNPAHRVGEVPVEARKEAKPVFAGKRWPPARPGAGKREAAGLTADGVPGLDDGHLETALAELVRRAHSRDPSTEHEHPAGHLRIVCEDEVGVHRLEVQVAVMLVRRRSYIRNAPCRIGSSARQRSER